MGEMEDKSDCPSQILIARISLHQRTPPRGPNANLLFQDSAQEGLVEVYEGDIRHIRKSQPTIRQTPDVGLTKNDTVDSIDSQTEGKEGDGRS